MSERGNFSRRQLIREAIKRADKSPFIAPAGLGVGSVGFFIDSRPVMVVGGVIIVFGTVKATWEFSQLARRTFSDYRELEREDKNQSNDKDKQA